jgi:RNA polymerase sigma-70 factor (ECF subfamily)
MVHHQRCNVRLHLHRKCTFMPYERHGSDATGLEYLDGLYGYAIVLTRNHAEAEDLVQDTYVRALPAMDRLRSESNVKGWLFKILRNAWLNNLRKRRTDPVIAWTDEEDGSAREIVEPSKDSYHALVSKMEKEQVQAAIQALSVQFREIILLREFEELSYDEIAKLLDCPVGTVMSRLARARSKLRVLLTCTRSEASAGKVRSEGLR